MSKDAKRANKPRAAPKPKQHRSTQTKSQSAHGPTSPWTWSLVSPTWTDTMLSLMIVDHFSKAIILVACNVELSAEGWAWILHDHIYTCHGMPQVVISDCSPQFISKFMKELYWMLDITLNASTAFHPQTDGTDRASQPRDREISSHLRLLSTNGLERLGSPSPSLCITTEFIARLARACSWYYMVIIQGSSPNSPRSSPFTNLTAEAFVKNMTTVYKKPRRLSTKQRPAWRPNMTKSDVLPICTKSAIEHG